MIPKSCTLRRMERTDAPALAQGFAAQGWNRPASYFDGYFDDQDAGTRQLLLAEYEGAPVGYLTLIPQAHEGPFAAAGLPEITDFNVLEAFQKHGIGSALMEEAEQMARRLAPIVTLGVGLHSGYGPAQRLYIKRGYLPDGSGVWYQDRQLHSHAECGNVDDLVLYLSKPLWIRDGIRLRPYQPEDLPAVLALFRETVHRVASRDYTPEQREAWAPAQPDLPRWEDSLSAHYSLIAEAEGRIVGFADLDSSGYLDRLYIAADFQGRGAASLLTDGLEARAVGLGLSSLRTDASITARPFFEKRGYRLLREQRVARNGISLTNYAMEKALPGQHIETN